MLLFLMKTFQLDVCLKYTTIRTSIIRKERVSIAAVYLIYTLFSTQVKALSLDQQNLCTQINKIYVYSLTEQNLCHKPTKYTLHEFHTTFNINFSKSSLHK